MYGENEEEGGPGLGYAEGGDHCGWGWGDMVCVMRGDFWTAAGLAAQFGVV